MFNPLNLLRKAPEKPESFIALDFGTTSTKAFIFSLDEKVQLRGQGQGTPKEAVEQAVTQAGVKPQQAVVGIGGQNAWCLTTTVRFNRPEPEKKIEAAEIKKLNEQVFKTALMQATPQMSQFLGDLGLTLQLIDSEVLYYKLDGKVYPPTNSPRGEIGRVLESSIFTAYSPTTYLEQLSLTLKELDLNLWAVCSLMAILTKALANNNPLDFNAIILDVGGRVTDVAVVFGGGIWGSRPLPLGGETFTLALTKHLGTDREEAEKKKIAFANHQLRDEEVLRIKEGIKPAVELWSSGVESALSDFEGIKTFPRRLILTGGGAHLEELKEGLATYPLMRTLPFTSPPLVEVRTDVGPWNMKLVARDILSGEDNAT